MMTFGEYLKERRNAIGWTQPEAAAKAEIEQSYLSKLETGKAHPSDEVFQRLIATYSLKPEDVLEALPRAEAERLRHIDSVRLALLKQSETAALASRRWLVAGVSALAMGGALLGLSQLDPARSYTQFTYQSRGVILPGEDVNVFEALDDAPAADAPDAAVRTAKRDELVKRADYQTQLIEEMKGPAFVENLSEGKRVWRLVGGTELQTKDRFGWAKIPAFMLILGGLGCFFVNWRWPLRYQR